MKPNFYELIICLLLVFSLNGCATKTESGQEIAADVSGGGSGSSGTFFLDFIFGKKDTDRTRKMDADSEMHAVSSGSWNAWNNDTMQGYDRPDEK
jgi:hypothetical protein